ncbi:MAG: hypothetical protein ABR968_08155 [Bacteroidales bacterium]
MFSKHTENIIPKFRESEMDLVNPEKNFFFKSGGVFERFIAVNDGEVVGRISAMINPRMNFEEKHTGLIGLFECVNEYAVAENLLNKAIDWLRNKECEIVIGPVDFSIWHNYRFQTSGFDEKPYIGEPRNPEYYPELFTRYGFEPCFEWQTRIVDKSGMRTFIKNQSEQLQLFDKLGYKALSFTKKNEKKFFDISYDLVTEIYRSFAGFSGISKKDYYEMYSSVLSLLDKDASFIGVDPSGNPIGFLFVLKDRVTALMKMNGKTNFLAKIKYLFNSGKSEYANIYQGGIKINAIRQAMVIGNKKYDMPLNLGRVAISKSMEAICDSEKYKFAIFPLMRENAPNRHYTDELYVKMRTHHLFNIKL